MLCEHLLRALTDCGTSVTEEGCQLISRLRLPSDLLSAWILNVVRAGAFDAVDGAKDVWFVQVGRRAAEFVPAARVDDEQAAVGVLQHVRRMEVDVVADQKVGMLGFECGSFGRQHMPGEAVHVEQAAEEVTAIVIAELIGFEMSQPARCRWTEM